MMIDIDQLTQFKGSEELTAFNSFLCGIYAATPYPLPAAQARAQARQKLIDMSGGQLAVSSRARWMEVGGQAEPPLRMRVIDHPDPAGIYLSVHGGGFALGAADERDPYLEALSDALAVTVVEVDYRLAPETPFPGGLDDCERAARWVADHAADLGAERMVIGGESSGATLVLATLLRLRDTPAALPIRAGSLVSGVYDLSMTPSQLADGEDPMLARGRLEWFYDLYVPDGVDRRNPEVSPLYADLSGLPPLLLTVGPLDRLLDDTLFLAARLAAAGNACTLHVVSGGDHHFEIAPAPEAAEAGRRIVEFLGERIRP